VTKKNERNKLASNASGLFTRRGIASAFGVHMQTVTGWEQEGMPIALRGARGRPSMYRLPDCIEWKTTRDVKALGGGEELSPQVEKALLDRKRREELELKILQRRGELVEVADVEREFEDCANAVKARLRRIPDAVADRVLTAGGPHAVKALLLAEIDAALTELSERGEDGDDDETEDAA
jgi:phage terminase Nu1 subunit (DNA packaging protein)